LQQTATKIQLPLILAISKDNKMADEINITERILNKLEKLDERLDDTSLSLIEIKGDLKEHMSRTLAVEKTNELIDKKTDAFYQRNSERITKLEKWYDKFHYLGWLGLGAIGVLEAARNLKDILEFFK
jgi:hypothetical protein